MKKATTSSKKKAPQKKIQQQKNQEKTINKLYGSANKKYLKGQFNETLVDLQKILDIDGSHADALTLAGEAYGRIGDVDNAWLCFNTALNTKCSDDKILTLRGEAYKLKGKTELALSDFMSALKINPQNTLALNLRGELCKSAGLFKEALEHFNLVLKLEPNNVFALTHRGDTYACMREFDKAHIDYEQALRFDNNYQDIFLLRANTYKMQGEFNKALETLHCFKHKEIKSQNLFHFFFLRAEVYNELQEWQNALENINFILEFEPKSVVALTLRGNIYASINNFESGLNDFNLALTVFDHKPLNPFLKAEILTDRAKLYLLQTAKNTNPDEAALIATIENKALRDLAQALSIAPSYFKAVTMYWGTKKKNGQLNEAIDIANVFIENNPENIPMYMLRGVTHKELGNFEKAISDFEHALTVEPQNSNLRQEIAEIKAMQQANQKIEIPLHSFDNEDIKSEEYTCNHDDYNDEPESEEYTCTQGGYSDNEDNAFLSLSKHQRLHKTNSTQNLHDTRQTTCDLTRTLSSYKITANKTQKQTFFSLKNSRNMNVELKNGSIKIQEKLSKFFSHTKKSKNNTSEPSWFNGLFNSSSEGIVRIEDPKKQRFIFLNASKDQKILDLLNKKIKKGGFNRTKDLRRLEKRVGQYFCDINLPGKESFEKRQFMFEVKFAHSEDRILAVVIPADDKRTELLIPLYYQPAFHTKGAIKAMSASCPKIRIEWPKSIEKVNICG